MHRLRDLPRQRLLLAVLVLFALAVPFGASVARAVGDGFRASNDDALLALRVYDVLDGRFPLVGQPSTAEQYADTDPPHHPGPIQFYVFAPVVGAVGADVGMLVGAALVNGVSVLVAVWVVFRRAGPLVGLGAAVVFGLLAYAQGPAQLSDPVSSNMGGIPLLALAVLAWAVVLGDIRLLPLAALWFAWVFQQHLAVVAMASGTAAWAGVGVVVAVVGWHRGRRAGTPPWPWVGAAAAVTVVAWAPVLWDQFFGSGNLGRMFRFAGSSDRPALGWASGLRQAARAFGPVPLLVRTDLTGGQVIAPLPLLGAVGALVVVAVLLAIAWIDRRRAPGRALLALTALGVAGLGVITGSNVPDSVEAGRINFYRWTFVVGALAWLAIGWTVASLVRRRLDSTDRRPVRLGTLDSPARLVVVPVAVVLVMALVAVTVSGPTRRRDQAIFAIEDRITPAVIDALGPPGDRPVVVVPAGMSAGLSLAPALVLHLVEAGYEVRVPPVWRAGYGKHFVADPTDLGALGPAVVMATGRGGVDAVPGEVVLRIDLNAQAADARVTIADQARSQKLVRSPRADDVLRELIGTADSPRAILFAMLLENVANEPEEVLRHGLVADALRAGYFTSPTFDTDALDVLIAHPPVESWGEDHIEIRLVPAADLVAERDRIGLGAP